MEEEYLHQELTAKIIAAFYKVYNTLGYGFLEKVYESAMKIELEKMDLKVERQSPINVMYDNFLVGEYYSDLTVEDKVIIEIKACETLAKEHELQLVNYLKATIVEIGLLFNFGKQPELKRKIFTNNNKNLRTSV